MKQVWSAVLFILLALALATVCLKYWRWEGDPAPRPEFPEVTYCGSFDRDTAV